MEDKTQKTPRSALTQDSDRSDDSSSTDSHGSFNIVRPARRRMQYKSPKGPSAEMRVLLPELVQITDVMPELWDKDIIGHSCYFERYGKIEKVALCIKEGEAPTKKITKFLFITYKNQLDAALTIAAMQNYRHFQYKCLANYGATRYCAAFIKNQPCTYQNCYFLHEMREESVTVQNMRVMDKNEKIGSAYSRISDNLMYFIQKEYKQFVNLKKRGSKSGFVRCQCNQLTKNNLIQLPTIKQTLSWLIEEGIIQQQAYTQLKAEYKANLKQLRQIPNAINLIQQNKKQEEETIQNIIQEVNARSEPYLLSRYLNPQLREAEMLDPVLKNLQDYYKKRQFQLKIRRPKNQKTLSMYEKLMNPSMALNSYIHHKIIQQVAWRPSTMTSAFQFACNQYHNPELQKIKLMVYRQLIINI